MIIADENLDVRIIAAIRDISIPVYSIAESCPGISDEEIAEIAKESGDIIVTRDKDFSDIVFAYGMVGISVMLLRYRTKNTKQIIVQIINLLKKDPNELYGKFITISESRIRTHTI